MTARSRFVTSRFCWLVSLMILLGTGLVVEAQDWRNIKNGSILPSKNYADQPFVIVLNDGTWLVLLTTGPGKEGAAGQHIVSSISKDQGQSWTPFSDIEPSLPKQRAEASWVVPFHVPGLGEQKKGRVYAFYTYNGDHVDVGRSDVIGWYAFKYTDDGGKTWSNTRYRVPVPKTEIDIHNDLQGAHMRGWGVAKPFRKEGVVYICYTKTREHLIKGGEAWIFSSSNLLTEPDPNKITWEFLPVDANNSNPLIFRTNDPIQTFPNWKGLRNPSHGMTQEEFVAVPLMQPGHLAMVNRTTLGFPAISYSQNGGRTWNGPQPMTYKPQGTRRLKQSRANIPIWRTSSGKYLLWHHFNGAKSYHQRNPAWICAGAEDAKGKIHWSQPEILLYDTNPKERMSYPDLIEQNGKFWVTETQKVTARVHQIDSEFITKLFRWQSNNTVAQDGKKIDVLPANGAATSVTMPHLPSLASNGGLTMDFWIELNSLTSRQIIAQNLDDSGKGFVVQTTSDSRLEIRLNDGAHVATSNTQKGAIVAGKVQHVAIIVDGAANLISWVVDGKLLDGGEEREFGWTRFYNNMGDLNASKTLRIAVKLDGRLTRFRLYDRSLMTTEMIGNYREGREE